MKVSSERARSIWAAANGFPGSAIWITAVFATLVANYPVVFAGRSLYSPQPEGQDARTPGGQAANEYGAETAWSAELLSRIQHRALFVDREWPMWNRRDATGSPLVGQPESSLGDPLQVIPVLADGAPWALDLKLLLAKGLFAGGIGFCVWSLTRSLPASLLMSASTAFLGFFVSRVDAPAISGVCYLPWILYLWIRAAQSPSASSSVLRMAALVGANFAAMNRGPLGETCLLMFWINATGLGLLCASSRALKEKLCLLGGAAAGAVVLALIDAPYWLTLYDALKRADPTQAEPGGFQIPPGLMIGFFDGAFLGPFQPFAHSFPASANVLILVGVLWVVVRWREAAASPVARVLILSSVPALILVFGVIPTRLVAQVPFLVHALHDGAGLSCAAITILAVLAGLGWKEAGERLGSTGGKREGIAVLALLIGLYGAYLGTAQAIVRSAYFDSAWGSMIHLGVFIHAYGLSLILAVAALLWVLHRVGRRGAPTPAMVPCALAAFAALHWREGLQLGTLFPGYVAVPAHRVDVGAVSPASAALAASGEGPFRAIGFSGDFLSANPVGSDLDGISGSGALVNPYYRKLLDASGIEGLWDGRRRLQRGQVPSVAPLLDLLGVRYYLDIPAEEGQANPALKPLPSAGSGSFESPSAWPRAFFTDRVALYDEPEHFLDLVRSGDGRPFAALTEGDWLKIVPLPRIAPGLGPHRVRAADRYAETANTTSFSVAAPGPGFIVLTEAYERGNFLATLNGRSVPYVRINGAFKGIYVDGPGTYRVTFRYWPRDLSLALGLAGAGLVALFIALGAAIVVLKPGPPPMQPLA
jgi:hypothetical protein